MKLYIDQKNNVVTMHEASGDMKCFEEFENSKPYTFDTVKEVKGLENSKGFRKFSPYIAQYKYDR